MNKQRTETLIVGGGPSGLAAAIELKHRGAGRVLVVDRESEMGGIPRHSDHIGYGMVDLHRVLSGPAYARRYVTAAAKAGIEMGTETSVVGWAGDRTLATTSASGLAEIEADAIVLATGCRERPRSARLIPGSRPAGVFTTGSLQQFVHLHGRNIGTRAVVVGAEHISFSALLTLSHAGVKTVAMVTDLPRHQTYPPFNLITAMRQRVPVLRGKKVTNVIGRGRVEAVEVTDLATSAVSRIDCDTVVFTGDWIPDHELARLAGLELDPGTKGPRVDGALRTSAPGVFASGNLLHGVETSDVAALEGRHVAASVRDWLEAGKWPAQPGVPIEAAGSISWISPNLVIPGGGMPMGGQFTLRVPRFVERGRVVVCQGERTLWSGRPTSGMLSTFAPALPEFLLHGALVPGRPVHFPAGWARNVQEGAGPVTVDVVEG
jgi:thioredoxin reductase